MTRYFTTICDDGTVIRRPLTVAEMFRESCKKELGIDVTEQNLELWFNLLSNRDTSRWLIKSNFKINGK